MRAQLVVRASKDALRVKTRWLRHTPQRPRHFPCTGSGSADADIVFSCELQDDFFDQLPAGSGVCHDNDAAAIFLIFAILAAFVGHVLMNYPVNFLSIFGIIALSGLVINGSLVLMLRYREGIEARVVPRDALIEAATRRFRPITLTAMTTTAGLTPLLFEQSLQAQFLVPMAISLSFGALFSVFVVLVFIPAFATLVTSELRNAPEEKGAGDAFAPAE